MVIGESSERNMSFCHYYWHQILQTSVCQLYEYQRPSGFSFCQNYWHQRLQTSVSVGFMDHRDFQAQISFRRFGSSVLQASGSISFIGSRAPQALVSARIIDRKDVRRQYVSELLASDIIVSNFCQHY
jgi:hypothetical protein